MFAGTAGDVASGACVAGCMAFKLVVEPEMRVLYGAFLKLKNISMIIRVDQSKVAYNQWNILLCHRTACWMRIRTTTTKIN